MTNDPNDHLQKSSLHTFVVIKNLIALLMMYNIEYPISKKDKPKDKRSVSLIDAKNLMAESFISSIMTLEYIKGRLKWFDLQNLPIVEISNNMNKCSSYLAQQAVMSGAQETHHKEEQDYDSTWDSHLPE